MKVATFVVTVVCLILLSLRSLCSFQKPWLNWKHFCSLSVPPHNNIDPLCITNEPKLRLGKVARDLVPKSPIIASKVVKSLFVLDTIKQLMCSIIKKRFYLFKHIHLNIQMSIYLVLSYLQLLPLVQKQQWFHSNTCKSV